MTAFTVFAIGLAILAWWVGKAGEVMRDPERRRLEERDDGVPWGRWGPYLSERQWGTVREDDSADGDGDTVPDGCDPCPEDNPDDSDGDNDGFIYR